MNTSVVFASPKRKLENIKYEPNAGKIKSGGWSMKGVLPNFHLYSKSIQTVLLIIVGKLVKHICEYGRTNYAYMKIENEFPIELLMDGELKSKLLVEIN